ncbi:flagellar motor switch protein FliN [Shewanella sp. VB17]|nr:flagellar motor switch protein FliN [Shewanella sp. VB17]
MSTEDTDEDTGDDWADAMAEQEEPGDDWADAMSEQELKVETVELDELTDTAPALTEEDIKKLDGIMDIPVTISMEVGRSLINIRNLLQLNQGSVVELDRVAGEPLDVMVNGTLIAHGEVVVVNDKFGIRLTDVISQTERIKKLK